MYIVLLLDNLVCVVSIKFFVIVGIVEYLYDVIVFFKFVEGFGCFRFVE